MSSGIFLLFMLESLGHHFLYSERVGQRRGSATSVEQHLESQDGGTSC